MMDSYSNRASSLFTTFTTVLFTFATLNHLTYYIHPTSITGSIKLATSPNLEFTEFKQYKADQVRFDFDLSVDLSTEYSWNVNQLYVFVVASYETSKNSRNEIIIYDKIIRNLKDYKINLKQVKTKYPLRDEFKNTLAGKNVQLSVRYQVMPVFGLMQTKEVPNAAAKLSIPNQYTKK